MKRTGVLIGCALLLLVPGCGKGALEAERARSRAQKEQLTRRQQEFEQARARIEDLTIAEKSLRADLTAARAGTEEREAELRAVREEMSAIRGRYDLLAAEHGKLAETVKAQERQYRELRDECEAARSRTEAALREKRDAVEMLEVVRKALIEAEAALAALRAGGGGTRKPVPEPPEASTVPVIKCLVRAVDPELGVVILTVGGDDGVKAGYRFIVYRDTEYVGSVTVEKVERDHCIGRSDKSVEKSPIRVGDRAATKL